MGSAQRIVIFSYLLIGILTAVTLSKVFSTIALTAGAPDPDVLGNQLSLMDVIAGVITAGVGFWLYKKPSVHEWALDVINELRKVTWPSRKETQTATVVVIITTLLAAVVLGIFDQMWALVTGLLYTKAS